MARIETQYVRLYKPHPGQQEVIDSPARFKVLMNGRRWGKTRLCVAECIFNAVNYGQRIWWIAPSYNIANVAWRQFVDVTEQLPQTNIRYADRMLEYPSGGTVTIKSADRANSLRSEGLDGLVMDEAAFIREDAWTNELRPALLDKKGWGMFPSTPNGKNWFWKLWNQANELEDWEAFQFTSADNPHLDPQEIEDAKNTMPWEVFQQEHLAIPMEGAGSVFSNITPNLNAEFDPDVELHKDHLKVMTIDWAKHNDFTVIVVGCLDCKCELEMQRFNEIDYIIQRDRIKQLYEKWDPEVVLAEANAMGEPNIELLWDEGIPVTSWTMTAANKPGLIRSLATALQREEWDFLDIPQATFELEAYQQKTNPSTGRSTYSAPSGANDDTVIARALLVYAENNYGHVPVVVV
jgi:hypothetical protein